MRYNNNGLSSGVQGIFYVRRWDTMKRCGRSCWG
uniref:Uncharacterized protein n=1 Tax=Myoviridae sp. ctHP32 TaxID=2823539 RepID=A0A8S5LFW7_9CAUD|nr:MAG TPA: hypothetical protein [Myoviridae sp. ctHP32]